MDFRRSSRCEILNQEGCVAVGTDAGVVGIQDTVNGESFIIANDQWRSFTDQVKSGKYDLD